MKRCHILGIVLLILSLTPIITVNPNWTSQQKKCTISQDMSRKEAIIQYIDALYIPNEGVFYAYLRDWPADPRFSLYHNLYNLYDPISVLKSLNASISAYKADSIEFASSHLNDESNYDTLGPINFSRITPCVLAATKVAVDIFPQLGIGNLLDTQAITQFVKNSQGVNGGFRDSPREDIDAEHLTATWAALHTLQATDEIDKIDTEQVISFLAGLYSNGGFSVTLDSSPDLSYLTVGLMCLDILNELELVNKEQVISNLLANWNNETGNIPDATLVDIERVIWALDILDSLDRIDTEAVVSYVLSCQTSEYGVFLPWRGANIEKERLVWAQAAVHILSILDRLETLDQDFEVIVAPEYEIPQSYYDAIDNLPTSTPSEPQDNGPHFQLPVINWNVVGVYVSYSILTSIILSPAIYWIYSERKRKRERRAIKKRRLGRRRYS